MPGKIMVGAAGKREGVAHLQATLGLSERWACSIDNADRKMIRYRSCRPPDAELRAYLRDLANERRRFGYRRLRRASRWRTGAGRCSPCAIRRKITETLIAAG